MHTKINEEEDKKSELNNFEQLLFNEMLQSNVDQKENCTKKKPLNKQNIEFMKSFITNPAILDLMKLFINNPFMFQMFKEFP